MMTSTGKYIALAAFFLLAMVCIFVGSVVGAVAFIALGVLLELTFWFGLFKSSRKRRSS